MALTSIIHLIVSTGPGGCRARSGGFGRSFWTLLASCYADPTVGRGQGTLYLGRWRFFPHDMESYGMSGSFTVSLFFAGGYSY